MKLGYEEIIETIDEGFEFVEIVKDKNRKFENTIKLRHKVCGYEFDTRLGNFRNRKKCALCASRKGEPVTMDHPIFLDRFNEREDSEEYVFLSEYKSLTKKISYLHKKCGRIYDVRPHELLFGNSKCMCTYNKVSYKHTVPELKRRIAAFNNDYEILRDDTDYIVLKKPTMFRHKTCGTEFEMYPYNFLKNGQECPKCTKRKAMMPSRSSNHNFIKDYLVELGYIIEEEKTFDDLRNPNTNRKLRFDFYIPVINAVIEYHGTQHFATYNSKSSNKSITASENFIENVKMRDRLKQEYCVQKDIKFLMLSGEDIEDKSYINKIRKLSNFILKI